MDKKEIKKDYGIEDAVQTNKSDEIAEFNKSFRERCRYLLRCQLYSELKDETNALKKRMTYAVRIASDKNRTSFFMGQFTGYMEALDEFNFIAERKENVVKSIESSKIENIPHINDIIVTISKDEGIRHGSLAQQVGIEKSTLSGIMMKLEESGIVSSLRPGKFKYYYLTEVGKQYYQDHQKDMVRSANIDIVIEQLKSIISRSNSPYKIIMKVMEAIYSEKYSKQDRISSLDSTQLIPMYLTWRPFKLEWFLTLNNSKMDRKKIDNETHDMKSLSIRGQNNEYVDLITFLHTVDGSLFDICARFYIDYLSAEENEDSAGKKLSLLLTSRLNTTKTLTIAQVYTAEEYMNSIKKTSKTINIIIDNLINEGINEEEFYVKIWYMISQKTLFSTQMDVVGAIICLMINDKIPYFQLDEGLKMNEDEFYNMTEKLIPQIQKTIFVLNRGYAKRTEEASQLLKIMNRIENENLKTVLLANVLNYLEEKNDKLHKKECSFDVFENLQMLD